MFYLGCDEDKANKEDFYSNIEILRVNMTLLAVAAISINGT